MYFFSAQYFFPLEAEILDQTTTIYLVESRYKMLEDVETSRCHMLFMHKK